MKNITDNMQLKNCIFLELIDFKKLVKQLLGKAIYVVADFGDLSFETDEEYVSSEKICLALSKHYDIQVTSIHVDDCDSIGVWIVYKEKIK